jgi:gliding motility-associated-like protein
LKNIIIIVSFVFGTALQAQVPKTVWAKQFAGKSFDGAYAVTTDAQGNVYSTGFFGGTVDFDPGTGVFNLTSISAEDIFICKLSAQGNFVWAKAIGDFRYQAGFAITLDGIGQNLYVTGIFFGSVDFDPGPGITRLTSAGNEDVFIMKFDVDGNFKWAKKTGGPTNDFSTGITTDNSGNVYTTGYFEGSSNFNTNGGSTIATANGLSDAFICKLSSSGNLIWVKTFGGNSTEAAYGIATDNANNVYAAGFFFGTADFNPSNSVVSLQAKGFGDGFILKLDTDGNFVKAIGIGSDSIVRVTNIKVNKANSKVVVGGYFDGLADFDGSNATYSLSATKGEEDAAVAMYDEDLNFIWAKQFSGPKQQRIFGLDTDVSGAVYTSGYFDMTADFDAGPQNFILTANTSQSLPDAFVCRLDAVGNFSWATQVQGNFFENGYSLSVTPSGDVFVGGTFHHIVDFDLGPNENLLTAEGESEIFLWKIKQCTNAPIIQNIDISTCTSYSLNNKTYTASGVYMQAFQNGFGCDSLIINLNLKINRIVDTVKAQICQGNSWLAAGTQQTKSGVYYDTLTSIIGCDSVIVTQLKVVLKPTPALGLNRPLCGDEPTILNAGLFVKYLWQDGTTQPQYKVINPGGYSVTVTDSNNCTASSSVQIFNRVEQPANFLPDSVVLCNNTYKQLSVAGYKNYLWNDGNTFSTKNIDNAGMFVLTVTDLNGCQGSDTVIVTNKVCIPIAIPNAFTPTSDGKNDAFRPVLNQLFTDYKMTIFNRSGMPIFSTSNYNTGWDGKLKNGQPAAVGNYIYVITYAGIGNTKPQIHTGNVLLLR